MSTAAPLEFANKVVIITGSSGGIGREIALDFGRQGASLTIHGQNGEKIRETAAQLEKAGVPADSILSVLGPIQEADTAEPIVNETLKRFGRIDVLVNNVGQHGKSCEVHGSGESYSLSNFDHVFAVNVRAVVQLTELAAPHLEKTGGNVVNISSALSVKPAPTIMFYSMSKAALDMFTHTVANVYAPRGVRVNSVNPGPVRSDIFTRQGIIGEDQVRVTDRVGELTILRRYAQPSEIAPTVTFVASSKAAYMTGSVIFVDGGMSSIGTR